MDALYQLSYIGFVRQYTTREPKTGFEPMTYPLRVDCSTTELLRQGLVFIPQKILIDYVLYLRLPKKVLPSRTRLLTALPLRPFPLFNPANVGERASQFSAIISKYDRACNVEWLYVYNHPCNFSNDSKDRTEQLRNRINSKRKYPDN